MLSIVPLVSTCIHVIYKCDLLQSVVLLGMLFIPVCVVCVVQVMKVVCCLVQVIPASEHFTVITGAVGNNII